MGELDENQMRAICIALGWQGGTYWQALEEIKQMRTEREELRARLAELERQEPVAWLAPAEISDDWPWPHAFFAADAHPHIRELMDAFPVYANPVPAIPEGWKLVNAGALAMVVNALRRDAEEGRQVRGEMADELLAAPEHEA